MLRSRNRTRTASEEESLAGGVQREGKGNVKVLLIPPLLERNIECFLKFFDDDHLRDWFTFYSVKPIPRRKNGKVDYPLMIQKCRKVIKEEKIAVLFANKETGSFVAAILRSEFPRIAGPTIESIFLCNHRLYTAQYVDSRKEKLSYISLNVNEDKYELTEKILCEIKLPCCISSCMGRSVCFARNRDELINSLEESRKGVEHSIDMHRYLIDQYIDEEKYPAASRSMVLVRGHFDRTPPTEDSYWIGATVEAAVFQGKIIPWAIANNVMLPRGDKTSNLFFSGYEMPTSLTSSQQTSLWTAFKADIQNLIKKGFDNSFIYGEYKVFSDGLVHLDRLHGHPHSEFTPLYAAALAAGAGNNLLAALQIGLQIKPDQPKASGSFVLHHSLVVFESGKSTNLLRFDKALANPAVSLRYLYGQDIVIEPTLSHAIIGTVTVKGTDFDTCFQKVKDIRKEILKLPELVPLTLGR